MERIADLLERIPTPVRNGIAGAVLLVFGFSAGLYVSGTGGARAFTGTPVALEPFWKLWDALDERFVGTEGEEPVTDREKLHGAMMGLAASYGDPYTTFLPPEDAKQFSEDIAGAFGGVGMEIGIRDGFITVVAPLKGTPAMQAGVKAGDIVATIDGKPTDGLSVEDAVRMIRGEVGTSVALTLVRDGKPLEISITRATIEVPTLEYEMKDGVFVIHIYSFSATAPNLFRDALRAFSTAGTEDLVIDLRGNPGGYLEGAVDMASFFLPIGTVVVTEDYAGKEENIVHKSYGYDPFRGEADVVILTDRGSASASEILTGALVQNGRATSLGETSFGKGSVQELVDFGADGTLKITVAHWKTPDGSVISGKGLAPTLEVKDETDDQVDDVLKKALEVLKAR